MRAEHEPRRGARARVVVRRARALAAVPALAPRLEESDALRARSGLGGGAQEGLLVRGGVGGLPSLTLPHPLPEQVLHGARTVAVRDAVARPIPHRLRLGDLHDAGLGGANSAVRERKHDGLQALKFGVEVRAGAPAHADGRRHDERDGRDRPARSCGSAWRHPSSASGA